MLIPIVVTGENLVATLINHVEVESPRKAMTETTKSDLT